MAFRVTIATEPYAAARGDSLDLTALRFAGARGTRRFTSSRTSDEQTMLEDAAQTIGALQRAGIMVERYSLDLT
jgi:hypothetical protein